jgi:hypothetical protein
MIRRLIPLTIAAAIASVASRPARADTAPRRELTTTLSSGAFVPEDHTYKLGPGSMYAAPPLLYVGLNLDAGLTSRLHVAADVGAELALGWVLGGSVRFVAFESDGVSLSVGAGPVVTLASPFGAGVFGRGDVGVRYAIPASRFVLSLNAGLAYSLQDAGIDRCGTDTCDAFIRRGDIVQMLVGSLGYAFML